MEDLKNPYKPVSDSPNTDAFEAVIELYYQLKGYITSSGKWFKTGETNSHYKDFDLLAVNDKYTLIVSVSSNLKEKATNSANVNDKTIDKTCSYFKDAKTYLQKVPEYKWLVDEREVKYILACLNFPQNFEKQKKKLNDKGIQILSPVDFIPTLLEDKNLYKTKVQNSTLRVIQVLIEGIKNEKGNELKNRISEKLGLKSN